LLLLAGTATGEWAGFDYRAVSLRSLASLGFLIAFGSLIGFTAYIWLLRVTTVARASTYAFVNPAVAVFLGWALAGEALTLRTLLAAGVIVAAVVVITVHQAHQAASAKPGAAARASKASEPIPCGGDSLAPHAAE
jgi:drug/metabolite transporter (DMT)-like permease